MKPSRPRERAIVVTGGSVYVSFPEDEYDGYVQHPQNSKKYWARDVNITSICYYNNENATTAKEKYYYDLDLRSNVMVEIMVAKYDGGGGEEPGSQQDIGVLEYKEDVPGFYKGVYITCDRDLFPPK